MQAGNERRAIDEQPTQPVTVQPRKDVAMINVQQPGRVFDTQCGDISQLNNKAVVGMQLGNALYQPLLGLDISKTARDKSASVASLNN